MKIGLVIYGSLDTVSGGYLYDRKLVAYLRSRGDEVTVLSIPTGHYLGHLLDNFSFRLPPDFEIIIEDELVHPSLLAANRAHSLKGGCAVPLVSLVHNLHSSEPRAAWQNAFYRTIERRHLASVDGHVFNSTVTQGSVARLVDHVKPHVLAPPGGDRLGHLSFDAIQERLSRKGPLRLVFLANLIPLKGLHVLLEALRELPPGVCTLDVAGSLDIDAAYSARMRQAASSYTMPVTFHGAVDGQPLVDLLTQSDVLVIPSYYEGFGIAYLEGMAFGLPAIGTTAGAIPQMIQQGVNGLMIEPGDADGLKAVIRRLADDRRLLGRLSIGARTRFDTCPTWEYSGQAVRGFLLQLLGRDLSNQPDDRREQ
ncbi:MAG TPA: glycosyltransferase family 4 protein [Anaerolineales bacterium]